MNKLRPYKNTYKLPIHRHTPVRYRQSKWRIHIINDDRASVAVAPLQPSFIEHFFYDLQRVPKRISILERVNKRNTELIATDIETALFGKNLSTNKVWGDDSEIKYVNTEVRFMSSPTKKLGIFQNIWNKIKKLRRKDGNAK